MSKIFKMNSKLNVANIEIVLAIAVISIGGWTLVAHSLGAL